VTSCVGNEFNNIRLEDVMEDDRSIEEPKVGTASNRQKRRCPLGEQTIFMAILNPNLDAERKT
jgi:hypothetical protein